MLAPCLPAVIHTANSAAPNPPNKEVRVGQVEISRIRVAPGLTAGRGLKLPQQRTEANQTSGCARPNRRARIETRRRGPPASAARRGCARPNRRARIETLTRPSPGRGAYSCARPNRRARIETLTRPSPGRGAYSCARPNRRARIETRTWTRARPTASSCARPNRRARIETRRAPARRQAAPGLRPA